MTDFLVKRDDIRKSRIAESEALELASGQALLRVDRFGLTSNNVTYAVLGDVMSYWNFFPAEQGWGRVPMWGFAEVERSEADGVEPGGRVYGYLPPSSHLVVTPEGASDSGFVDASPHRSELPAAYQRYVFTGPDPFHRPDTEDVQMLLRPLFFTSFLIDDQLDDEQLTARGPIVISSASSKTAIGAAYLLAQREGVELVGLTSSRSVAFVEELGIYGRTVTYDAIDSLEPGPATFVDIAGNGEVSRAVHARFGDDLAYSMTVGVTHWEGTGGDTGADLPGPAPIFFFAPDRVEKLSRDCAASKLGREVAEAWHGFCDWTGGWLEVVHGEGFEAVQSAYLDVLEGRVEPKAAHVLSLR